MQNQSMNINNKSLTNLNQSHNKSMQQLSTRHNISQQLNLTKAKAYDESTKDKYVYKDHEDLVYANAGVYKEHYDYSRDDFLALTSGQDDLKANIKSKFDYLQMDVNSQIERLDSILANFNEEQAQWVTAVQDELNFCNDDTTVLINDCNWGLTKSRDLMEFIGAEFSEDLMSGIVGTE